VPILCMRVIHTSYIEYGSRKLYQFENLSWGKFPEMLMETYHLHLDVWIRGDSMPLFSFPLLLLLLLPPSPLHFLRKLFLHYSPSDTSTQVHQLSHRPLWHHWKVIIFYFQHTCTSHTKLKCTRLILPVWQVTQDVC
jgi:hypothetical protein